MRMKGELITTYLAALQETTYLAALQELSEHYSFRNMLIEMLQDQLVCSVNHEGIQQRLLAEKNLSYEKAFKIEAEHGYP